MGKEQRKSAHQATGSKPTSAKPDDGVILRVPYSYFGAVYDEEEERAVLAAMKQDRQTKGPNVEKFEKEFAAMCSVKHALATSNCTTAMHVATQAMGIKDGDEVIITPNTFIATSLVLLKEGARPVYSDIDPKTFNIDPDGIEEKITPRTKAIYLVHYGGQICDMDPIVKIAKKHNLYVLEDCAHTPGAEYKGRKAGSIGDVGCFSFHSLKNMTTLGEGGMVTTNNDEIAAKVARLRAMSTATWDFPEEQNTFTFAGYTLTKTSTSDYWIPSHHDVTDDDGKWGNNYRMNETQSAVGVCQLRKLKWMNEKRRELSRYITEGIKDVEGVTPVYEDPNCYHVYHLYTLCVEEEMGIERDAFLRLLYREHGIQPILHYQPTYHYSGLKKLGYPDKLCPVAEKFFYKRELNLPIHPRLTKEDCDIMIEGIRKSAVKDMQK